MREISTSEFPVEVEETTFDFSAIPAPRKLPESRSTTQKDPADSTPVEAAEVPRQPAIKERKSSRVAKKPETLIEVM